MQGVSYQFGPFRVDRGRYQVTRDGEAVILTPQLMDLLLYLLDRPAVLVTKDELLDALWPGANVTENALTQAVSELRQALGDSAGAPHYIKTIARRGYRFIADVSRTVDEQQEVPSPGPSPAAPPVTADLQTIVVQDFHNVAADAEYAWLSAGIAETVTGDLRALGHFRVVDRWRVTEALRRTDGSLEQVARAVHAHVAVVGSFQRSADRIRITARVVDMVGGEALADAKADGPLTNIFDLQDQIVAAFARDLHLPQPRHSGVAAVPRETQRLDAYRAFTEGLVRLESFDVRELAQAVADFERAVSLDRQYAAAYVGLANAEVASYETTRFEIEPATHVLERAIAHARQAAALDDGLAEAHGALALALSSAWRMPEAVAAAQRAVSLEPVNWRHLFRLCRAAWGDSRLVAGRRTLSLFPEFALSYFQMAMVHIARGRLAEAEALLRMGAGVQDQQIAHGERLPGRGLHWLLGMTRLAQGDVPDALCEFDRELSNADLHHLHGREFAVRSHLGRGLAMLSTGAADEAAAACRRALELYPLHPESHLGLALALTALGSARAATAEIAKAEEALSVLARARPFEAATLSASMCVVRGQHDEAVTTLAALIDTAHPAAAWSLPIDPLLQPLRKDEGFRAILDRLAVLAR
jgi:DNA-binding winged helix-turn-helix (wHTH) protein/tetratricopeptide (TPR) repeat protein